MNGFIREPEEFSAPIHSPHTEDSICTLFYISSTYNGVCLARSRHLMMICENVSVLKLEEISHCLDADRNLYYLWKWFMKIILWPFQLKKMSLKTPWILPNLASCFRKNPPQITLDEWILFLKAFRWRMATYKAQRLPYWLSLCEDEYFLFSRYSLLSREWARLTVPAATALS